MTRHMMATLSVVLQLRTQILRVLSCPIKTLKKPFESLQSAAEPRQTVPLGTPMARRYIYISTSVLRPWDHTAWDCDHF